MLEYLLHFLAFFLFFLPGGSIAALLRLRNLDEFVGVSILLSLALAGNFVVFFSNILPIQPWMMGGIVLGSGLFLLVVMQRERIQVEWPILSRGQLAILFLLLVLIGIFFVHDFLFPSNIYDSYSYHIPFIQSFRDHGVSPFFESPMNEYEWRANHYPKLYEALRGGIEQLSVPIATLLPGMVALGTILLLFALSRRLGSSSWYGSVFYVTIGMVYFQFLTDLNDVMIAFLCTGALLFILRVKDLPTAMNVAVAGFLLACIPLVKWTGFLPAGVLFLIAVVFTRLVHQWRALLAGIFLGGAHFFVWQLIHARLVFSNGVAGVQAGVELPISHYFHNLVNIGQYIALVKSNQSIGILLLFFGMWSIWILRSWSRVEDGKKILFLSAWGIGMGYLVYGLIGENPSLHGLFRYSFPFFAFAALGVGILFSSCEKKDRVNFTRGIFVSYAILLLIASSLFVIIYSVQRANDVTEYDRMERTIEIIPAGSVVFFANTYNPIVYHLENSIVQDSFSFAGENPSNACLFLKEKGITHIVFSPGLVRELGPLNASLSDQLSRGECGTLISRNPYWMELYRIT